jgi:hypothetical protein
MSTPQAVAKKFSQKATATTAQPLAKVELGRATVAAIPGDGTLTVNLNGSTVAMPVNDCTGGTAVVAGEVEVLIAPPRHIAIAVIGGTFVEMYDFGGDGATVDTLPTSGLRSIGITWVGACVTAVDMSSVTIDLTSLGLAHGYTSSLPAVTLLRASGRLRRLP